MASYAHAKGHKVILFSDDATELASKTLSAISLGQGYTVGELVSAVDVPTAYPGKSNQFSRMLI